MRLSSILRTCGRQRTDRTGRRSFGGAVIGGALLLLPLPSWAIDTLRIAHPFAPDSPVGAWAQDLAQEIEERTGIRAELLVGFGRPAELVGAVDYGGIDIALVPADAVTERAPPLSIFSEPALWPQTSEVLDDPTVIDILNDVGMQSNLDVLAFAWTPGILVVRGQHIEQTEDLQGRKIRSLSPSTNAVLQELGATTVQFAFSEVYTALQVGVIDGTVLPASVAAQAFDLGSGDSVVWSDHHALFASGYVVLAPFERFLDLGIDEELRQAARESAHRFLERELEQASMAMYQLEKSGVVVEQIGEDQMETWQLAADRVAESSKHDELSWKLRGYLREMF